MFCCFVLEVSVDRVVHYTEVVQRSAELGGMSVAVFLYVCGVGVGITALLFPHHVCHLHNSYLFPVPSLCLCIIYHRLLMLTYIKPIPYRNDALHIMYVVYVCV